MGPSHSLPYDLMSLGSSHRVVTTQDGKLGPQCPRKPPEQGRPSCHKQVRSTFTNPFFRSDEEALSCSPPGFIHVRQKETSV